MPRLSLFVRPAFVLSVAVYLTAHFDQGWVPHDEGALAQSAQRVLHGELPHRDFAELYTSGLTFLNAGVLKIFGQDIVWLRVPMLILFMLYLWVLYLLARRVVGPIISGLVVLFAVSWGLPTYPVAFPSWYLLTFSVFGIYCLVRFQETNRETWVLAAGLLGGLSVSFKITGVWYVLGAILFLLFLDSTERVSSKTPCRLSRRAILTCGPLLTSSLVVAVLRPHFGSAEIVNLAIPVLAICGTCVYAILRCSMREPEDRVVGLGRQLMLFSLGVVIPVTILLVPFLATGSEAELFNGVFLAPQARLDSANGAYMTTQSASYVLLGLFALCLGAAAYVPHRTIRRIARASIIAVLLLGIASGGTLTGYQAIWHTVRAWGPCIVVLGVIAVIRSMRRPVRNRSAQPVAFLLLAMIALLALNQFPFGAPIYYCFFAPISLLGVFAVLRLIGIDDAFVPGAILLMLVVFGFTRLDSGDVYSLGWTPVARASDVTLDPQRASIRVPRSDRETYQRVADLLEAHSTGQFAFAGPDAPEVYVLSGLRNPTRSLADFLDPTDSARGRRLIATLVRHDVTAIAINLEPTFSQQLEVPTMARLETLFPRSSRVGQFEIRWRSPSAR